MCFLTYRESCTGQLKVLCLWWEWVNINVLRGFMNLECHEWDLGIGCRKGGWMEWIRLHITVRGKDVVQVSLCVGERVSWRRTYRIRQWPVAWGCLHCVWAVVILEDSLSGVTSSWVKQKGVEEMHKMYEREKGWWDFSPFVLPTHLGRSSIW